MKDLADTLREVFPAYTPMSPAAVAASSQLSSIQVDHDPASESTLKNTRPDTPGRLNAEVESVLKDIFAGSASADGIEPGAFIKLGMDCRICEDALSTKRLSSIFKETSNESGCVPFPPLWGAYLLRKRFKGSIDIGPRTGQDSYPVDLFQDINQLHFCSGCHWQDE